MGNIIGAVKGILGVQTMAHPKSHKEEPNGIRVGVQEFWFECLGSV